MLSVPRAPDPHRLLLRALLVEFPDAALRFSRTTPWASATFVGARHQLTFDFATPQAAAAAAASVRGREFTLRRTLVADIVGTAAGMTVEIAALTIEEH